MCFGQTILSMKGLRMEEIMLVIIHVRRNIAIIAVTLIASLPFPEIAEAGNEGRPPKIGSYQHPHKDGHYQDHRAGHYQDHRNDSGAGRPPGPRYPGYQNPYVPGAPRSRREAPRSRQMVRQRRHAASLFRQGEIHPVDLR